MTCANLKKPEFYFIFLKVVSLFCVNKKKIVVIEVCFEQIKIEVKGYCLLVLFYMYSYNSYRVGQQGKSIELKIYSYILGGWLYNILRFISVPYYHSD